MKTETKDSQYCVCGAPGDNTPGYVLGYYETAASAKKAVAYFRKHHTVVWMKTKRPNGDYAN